MRDGIITRDGSGVGFRRSSPQSAGADLHHDHGLAIAPRQIKGCDKASTFANAFRIGANHFHFRRLRHPTNRLTQRNVGLIAGSHTNRGAKPALARHGKNMRAISAGLGGNADIAANGPALFEGKRKDRIKTDRGIEQAKAIRPQHAHAMPPCGGNKPFLHGGAGFIHFGKACGENNRGFAAARAQIIHGLNGGLTRHGDDSDIGHFRQRGDGSKGRQALHRWAIRVHGQKPALKTLALHISDGPPANARAVIGSTNHGNGTGANHGIQRREIGGGVYGTQRAAFGGHRVFLLQSGAGWRQRARAARGCFQMRKWMAAPAAPAATDSAA